MSLFQFLYGDGMRNLAMNIHRTLPRSESMTNFEIREPRRGRRPSVWIVGKGEWRCFVTYRTEKDLRKNESPFL